MKPMPDARQQGAALYVVLVLLLVIAWIAVAVARISGQQLQIVGNSQIEHDGIVVAQRAIDSTISSNDFSKDPAAVANIPIATDVDGDGAVDLTAKLTPQPACIRVRPIKTMELDVTKVGDRACLQSSGASGNLVQVPGVAVSAGDSLCAASEWDVAAAASDPKSNMSVTVHQGVTVRLVASDAKNYCK
jgi:hypothetical protein